MISAWELRGNGGVRFGTICHHLPISILMSHPGRDLFQSITGSHRARPGDPRVGAWRSAALRCARLSSSASMGCPSCDARGPPEAERSEGKQLRGASRDGAGSARHHESLFERSLALALPMHPIFRTLPPRSTRLKACHGVAPEPRALLEEGGCLVQPGLRRARRQKVEARASWASWVTPWN